MANLSYGTAIRDGVAGLIFQSAYSALSDAQKAVIEGATPWASGDPPGGAALSAWNLLNQYSQWWYMAGATVAPSVWQHWLIHLIVRIVGVNFRPDREALFKDLEQMSMRACLDTFTDVDPASNTVDAGALTSGMTLQNVRFHVMAATLGRNPPIFISPQEIDAATIRVARDLWGRAKWNFIRRWVTMTLTPYAVTDALWTESAKRITAPVTIPLSAATGTFTVGEIVTESTSSATGTVVSASTTTCRLRRTSVATFTGGQTLTGGTSGYTATGGTIANPFTTSITGGSQCVVTAGDTATLGTYMVASATADTVVLTTSIGATTGDTDISATTMTVGFNLQSGETVKKFANTKLTYTDTTAAGSELCWANPDVMARAMATMTPSTGRPAFFRFNGTAPTTTNWQFTPIPDTTYYLTCEVILDGPTDPVGTSGGATATTFFGLFPPSFYPLIKDRVLARCLLNRGVENGPLLWKQSEDEIDRLLPEYLDPGSVTNDSAVGRDVYRDSETYGWGNSLGGGLC